MGLKKIKHEWNVDKIIREANIQNFNETGLWRRGPEPNFSIIDKTIEALVTIVINQDERIKVNIRQSELLLRQVNRHGDKLDQLGVRMRELGNKVEQLAPELT